MLSFLKSLFRRSTPPIEESWDMGSDRRPPQQTESGEVRRWDAASTTEFNAIQWQNVTGRSINDDLVSYLPTLINRRTYEISTNSTLAGIRMMTALTPAYMQVTGIEWTLSDEEGPMTRLIVDRGTKEYADNAPRGRNAPVPAGPVAVPAVSPALIRMIENEMSASNSLNPGGRG